LTRIDTDCVMAYGLRAHKNILNSGLAQESEPLLKRRAMKICSFLKREHIFLDIACSDKLSVLNYVADAGKQAGVIQNRETLLSGIMAREAIMSTGVGDGIALPHTTSGEVSEACVLLIRLSKSIDFDSLDNLPVDIVLALLIPESDMHLHLRILAGVSRLCKNPEFLKTIRKALDPGQLWQDLAALESKMDFH